MKLGMTEDGKPIMRDWEQTALINKLEVSEQIIRRNQEPLRRNWRVLNKYLAGYQIYDPATQRYLNHRQALMQDDTFDVDKEAVIFNDLLRQHVSNVERLSGYQIDPQVIPDDRKPSSKKGARYGTMALKDLIRRNNEEKIKLRIATLLDKFGAAFIKVLFDPTKGRTIVQPEINHFGKWEFGSDMGYEGEVVWDVVSPENLFLPRFTADLENCDFVQELNIRSTDYVYRRYGQSVKEQEIQAADMWLTSVMDFEEPNQQQREVGTDSKRVLVKERWYRPCTEYPNGAHFVWANKVLLVSSELNKYYPDLPYFGVQMIFQEKSCFGDSLLWHLLPHQDMKNKGVSSVYRHLELMAQNKWLIPTGCNVDENDLDNATGGAIKYDAGQHGEKPEILKPPDLQATVFTFLQLVDNEEMKLGANHDIARNSRPPSGAAVGALQDMDNSVVVPTIRTTEQALGKACSFSLELIDRYYDTNHLLKSGGGVKGWMIVDNFRGEMLEKQFHSEVNLMTGMPTNRFAKLQFLTEQFKIGLLTKQEVTPYLEYGDVDTSLQEIQEEQEIADAIVECLANEETYQQVTPHDFDNHALIVDALIKYMRREDYDSWPAWQKEAFIKARAWHEEQIQMAMRASAPPVQAGPPSGGPPGGPPGPPPAGISPVGETPQDQPNPDSQVPPLAPGFGNAEGVPQ